jgi:predicted DNA-binding protein
LKTIAVRLNQETFDLLEVVSQLEATTIVDQIRVAIAAHLERKVADGELAARAQSALEDIDREAAARKEAIGSLIGTLPTSTPPPGKSRQRRGAASESEGESPKLRPIGFAPPSRTQRREAPERL